MSNLTFQCSCCQIGLLLKKKENQRWKLYNLDYGFGTVCIGSDISCCNTEHIQVLLSLALAPSQTRDKKSTKISPPDFCTGYYFLSYYLLCIFYDLFMLPVFFGPLFIHFSCSGSQTRKCGLISECIVFNDLFRKKGILFRKMFWPTVRKTYWKFETENLEFVNIVNSLHRTMYLNSERSEQFLEQNTF